MASYYESMIVFKDILRDQGFDTSFGKNVWGSNYQRILYRNKEDINNTLIKASIGKVLFDSRKSFVGDWELKKHGERKTYDTIDLVNVDDKIIYSFNKQSSDYGFKKKFINLQILPGEVNESIKIINEFSKSLI